MGSYAELVRRHDEGRLDSSAMRIVQLDEYLGIGPDDPRSLYGWMHRSLVAPLGIAPDRVIRFDSEAPDADRAARDYDDEIAAAGGIDLAILGIGVNGHLGFNEPPSDCRCSHAGGRPLAGYPDQQRRLLGRSARADAGHDSGHVGDPVGASHPSPRLRSVQGGDPRSAPALGTRSVAPRLAARGPPRHRGARRPGRPRRVSIYLGVDGGNSKAVAVVATAGGDVLAAARQLGTADIYAAGGERASIDLVARAVGEALDIAGTRHSEITRAVFSLAGADWPEDFAYHEQAWSEFGFGGPVSIVNDAIGALVGAVPTGPAVAVSIRDRRGDGRTRRRRQPVALELLAVAARGRRACAAGLPGCRPCRAGHRSGHHHARPGDRHHR